MKTKNIIILFALILAIGVFSRLYNLDKEPLWMDEGYTLETITWGQNESAITQRAWERESTPPHYFILLYDFTNRFGLNVYNMRLFSVIFSCLSLILIFLIAKEIFNTKIGLMAMMIAAIFPVELTLAQEARVYALFVFVSLCSWYFFIRYLKEKELLSRINLCITTAINIILVCTHYFALFVIGMEILIMILFNHHFKKRHYLIMGFPLFLWLKTDFRNQIINNLLFLKDIIFNNNKILVLAIILILGFIFLLRTIIKQRKTHFLDDFELNKWHIIITINATLLFLTTFGWLLNRPIFYVRYLSFLFPFLYILLAWMSQKMKGTKLMMGTILIILALTDLGYYYGSDRKEQWDDVAKYIQDNENVNDTIFLIDKDLKIIFRYYYNGSLSVISTPSTSNITSSEKQWESLSWLLASRDNVWWIRSHDSASGDFWENKLNQTYNITKIDKDYKGVRLYYLDK